LKNRYNLIISIKFLRTDKRISSKLKLLIRILFFVGVINIILMLNLIKNHWFISGNWMKRTKLHQF